LFPSNPFLLTKEIIRDDELELVWELIICQKKLEALKF